MRIAVSGSHRTGKTTLIGELSARLPDYAVIDEPYNLMTEEGYEFSDPPSLEDFEAQLQLSIDSLTGEGHPDVFLDRCPLDLLGYIFTHADGGSFEPDAWMPRVRAALKTIDVIVFVPIETRDRIRFSSSDDTGGTRAVVDETLRAILLDDSLDLGVEVLEVEGDVETRVKTVMRRILKA